LRTAAEEAARHLAVALSMRFASVELEGAAVHSARVAIPLRADDVVLGFLQVPDDLPRVTRQRLLRLLPTFEALLAAARERENINKRFIESRQRLERFFDLSSDLMVISDQANFLQVNPAFERTLGYTADDLAPAPFDLIWPEDRDLLREPVKELTDGGRPVRYEHRATSRDGSPRWLEWSVAPHRGLFYAVGRDVTKQRTEQEQLRKTHAMLEASRDALRTLAEQQAALRRIATLVAQGVSRGEVFCAVAEEMGRCPGYAAGWRALSSRWRQRSDEGRSHWTPGSNGQPRACHRRYSRITARVRRPVAGGSPDHRRRQGLGHGDRGHGRNRDKRRPAGSGAVARRY
jgi:PAS domain S-box-containing protein